MTFCNCSNFILKATFTVHYQCCSDDATPHCKTVAFEQLQKEFRFKQDMARPCKQQAHEIPYVFTLDSIKLVLIRGERAMLTWVDVAHKQRVRELFIRH